MRIKVYPEQSGENQFIQNIRRQLSEVDGVRVEGVPLNHRKLLMRLPYDLICRSDYTVVNWLENNVCARSGKLSVLGCLKFLGLLLLFRITCKRLIYVRHNLYPHRLKSRYSRTAQALVDRATLLLTERVALSEHMVNRGYRYVPHPLYRLPDPGSLGQHCGDLPGNEYFVIFGTISRYKGIDKIVQLWGGGHCLVVVGKVGDAGYLSELKMLAKGKNVTIRGGLLSDAEASRIISGSMGVILPHDSDEMIVSGAFFYSLALGVRVYAIRNEFYGWIVRDCQFPGLELFDDAENIVERLLCDPVEPSPVDRETIKKRASECFGDEVGVASWEKVIFQY
ncbi:hypothetical protein [Marinimicrobium locisalis]|uniref:hypothetical protein n=1 Tax=Marinimicrobium locisalis TaxID=546022 RepID=UPI003221930E